MNNDLANLLDAVKPIVELSLLEHRARGNLYSVSGGLGHSQVTWENLHQIRAVVDDITAKQQKNPTVTSTQTTFSGSAYKNKTKVQKMKTAATLETDGSGFGTREARTVRITAIGLGYVNDEGDFGELRVFYHSRDWMVEYYGIIYTDPKFIKGLREHLESLGIAAGEVEYSVTGRQTGKYVSFDVGKKFLESWHKVFG